MAKKKHKDKLAKKKLVAAHPKTLPRHASIYTPHHTLPSPSRVYPHTVAPIHPGHVAVPHRGHAHTCPSGDTHLHEVHKRLVKSIAQNAKLKATAKVQKQLLAQQKQHQKQMLASQAQIFRLQAQVELVSRREEIRDQLVEASAELAHAEILMDIAQDHPEAFLKMMRGEDHENVAVKNDGELQSLKAENAELKAKVAKLENQIGKLIEHTAKQQPTSKYNAR